MKDRIRKQIKESAEMKLRLLESDELINGILKVSEAIVEAIKKGNKLLLAGNGGSAADAQHFAAEFVNRFTFDRPGIPAIALTTDTSVLTAVANDYSFSEVFTRQLTTLGNAGDVFMAISTSGKSANIVRALEAAREKDIVTIGLTGSTGSEMERLCNICLIVPSNETARIQEAHILIIHIICLLVEEQLFNGR
ncbi:MAG TPA: SIS domain-containing protein [Bacteroidales bacterium]|nr:SIS domain-containing protein [Bacteroidales bacterium]HPF03357.1 SIS domain-containing protein [Bacteroidales bacterium]HPJ60362.1 SIS domain-containing protein [Bacteroidales bacterium]HPR13507.1 SIS domain-containing protein [Bacteroidales bacterium]HRW85074.1 SIS domain-containing protein [Bacteroidales bacterium]